MKNLKIQVIIATLCLLGITALAIVDYLINLLLR
jgi:hypothetical protein